MDGEVDWKVVAWKKQVQFFDSLGSRPYDEIEKSNLFLLKKKVGFATCGMPNDLPNSTNYYTGYSQKNLDCIMPICYQILEMSDQDIIKFGCVILVLFHENEMSETSVFKIGTKSGIVFIDVHSRVYGSWENFMENNKLPVCEYCFPENGEYHNNKEKVVNFAMSPACSTLNKTADCLDTVGSVACVGAAAVVGAGMCVTVAPAAVAVAGTTMFYTAGYSLARNTQTLYDRMKHYQSIGLRDREARSAWLSIASSAVGAATCKVIADVQQAGKPLTKLAAGCIRALTTTSVLFSGFGFLETLVVCKEKHEEGTLSKKDIFDLSCELLFLFNAIASAKATSQLVNNMSTAETSQSQRKLTKTQKRNLRKRAAKRSAKGLSPVMKETENGSNFGTPLNYLLREAAKYYVPRIEAITFTYHSIAHDVTCWQRNEMSDFVLLTNISTHLIKLYDKFNEEINEVSDKVMTYFKSVKFADIMDYICILFETAAEKLKTIFCNKVINTEDELEQIINNAEAEITELHNDLELNIEGNSSESMDSENLDDDVDELNQETQTILSSCNSLIESNSLPCTDINDFGEILDGVKCIIVSEFKEKIASYKANLKATKSLCGESFNLGAYHKALDIDGDVSQHYFNVILKGISGNNLVYKIKTKCKEMKKERQSRTTPVWEAAASEGIFHYYGPHGAGYLDKNAILDIVSEIVSQPLDNCKWVNKTNEEGEEELSGTFMIGLNSEPCTHIIIYQNITEENTAFGMMTVVTES